MDSVCDQSFCEFDSSQGATTMDVDDEEDLVPEITKAHFEEAMKFARRFVLIRILSRFDGNFKVCQWHLITEHLQVCVRQRYQEVRDVLADPSAEPWIRQQLQVCLTTFRCQGPGYPTLRKSKMVFCRFPDGSTGGNAPAGGSGQVNLKSYYL